MHAAAFCKVFTCHRFLYDRIHMSCTTIRIMMATFTPVVADLPLLPSRGNFNPAYGVCRFSNLPQRYLWGLSKPPVGAYGPRIAVPNVWQCTKPYFRKTFRTQTIFRKTFRPQVIILKDVSHPFHN